MASELPPSKFGAGTTYGQAGQPHALPTPSPAPTPTPPPYAAASGQQTPESYPGAAASYPPAPDPYAPPQFRAQASYPPPGAAGVLSAAPTAGGTAIAAGVLGVIGALWYGIDLVRGWDSVVALLQSLDQLSALGLDASIAAWAYGSIASVIAQLIFVPVLLIGGILLLFGNPAGRMMVLVGSVLVILVNIFWALAAFQAVGWMNNFAGGMGVNQFSGAIVANVLLNIGLPALLALVTAVLAASGSAKRWCRRAPAYVSAPTAY